MSLLLDDVRTKLVDDGVGGDASWPIFEGFLPDDQDQAIGLFETGGLPRDTLGGENTRPAFQTRVRGAAWDYVNVRNKWQAVFNSLQDAAAAAGSPATLPNVIFIQAVQTAPLHFNDEKHRPNMTCNWRCMRYK